MSVSSLIITSPSSSVNVTGDAVKKNRRHTRIICEQLSAREIDPALRSLGRHIARRRYRGLPVRIPAMRGSEWGHVLRALSFFIRGRKMK